MTGVRNEMKRIAGRSPITIAVVVVLLSTAFMVSVPESAEAGQATLYCLSGDGSVKRTEWEAGAVAWYCTPSWCPDALITGYCNWQFGNGSWYNEKYRSFLTFDTSVIPASALVTSATLRVKLTDTFLYYMPPENTVGVYLSDFTDGGVGALGTDDWDDYRDYQGVLWTTYDPKGNWYDISVNASAISTIQRTDFCLKAAIEKDIGEFEEYSEWDSVQMHYIPAELSVTWQEPGAEVSIRLDDNSYLNSTLYPEISEWNVTYDLYYFAVDLPSNAENLTIYKKDANWSFLSVAPDAPDRFENDTEVRFNDTYGGICYRVWFTVPKVSPYCTIHLSLYNAFTGEGFFWEAMRMSICNGTVWNDDYAAVMIRPDYAVELNRYYIIKASDYFGNELANISILASTADLYLRMAIPVYSWQVFNMNDEPIYMRIFWNQSLDPWAFFVGPNAIIERMLKAGDYTFMVTFYDCDGYAGATVFYNQSIPLPGVTASFVMVEGTTLTQIVSVVEGVLATQQIITTLLTPDMVWVYSNVPSAPDAEGIARQMTGIEIYSMFGSSYEVVSALRYDNATGTDIALWQPYEVSYGTTVSIYQDVLALSGPYTTAYWLNTTTGTVVSSGTVLPPLVTGLGGANLTLEANNSVTVSRTTNWKEVSLLTWTYSWNIRQYSTTQKLYNNLSSTMYNVYWSYYFQNPDELDLSSLEVYDNWNSVELVLGTHYDITSAGVHFYFNSLAAGINKSLTVTVYDRNESEPGDAIASITLYSDSAKSSFCGEGYKICTGTWSNAGAFSYYGTLVFKLDFEDSDKIQPRSVSVYSADDSRLLNPDEYYYAGGTVTVIGSTVGVITPGEGRTYLIAFLFDRDETYTLGLTKPLFVVGGIAISAIYFICVLVPCGAFLFVLTRRPGDRHYRRWDIFLLFLAISFILAALTALGVID